jgi:type II secretory pathway component PulM
VAEVQVTVDQPQEEAPQTPETTEALAAAAAASTQVGLELGRLESRLDSLPAQVQEAVTSALVPVLQALQELRSRVEELTDVVDAAGEFLAELEETTEPVEENSDNHDSAAAVEVQVPPPQTTPPVKPQRNGILRVLLG